MAENRYAGISPFTGEQKNVFFGRTSDIEKFYQQLKIEQQTLLYSKSGLGKSSLINAGIIPKLENEGIYTPIRIRFNAFTGTNDTIPVQKVVNEITSKIELSANSLIDEVGIAENDKNLWFLFKKMQLLYPEKRLILIFDQFEELFSYSEPIIEDFKNQLSDILKADVPENFVEYFAKARSKNKEKFRGKQMRLLNENVEVKTIYIIRSDKLSLLNKLRNRIANIQKSYYELLPLTPEQAREAIVKPAEMSGEFKTSNFSYKPESLTKIINFLTNKDEQAIETTQLQIICQRIEQNIFEHHRQEEKYEVDEKDLPDFKDIFLSFYTDTINRLDIKDREKAAILIENESIRNKQRISLDEFICSEYISAEALKMLVDNRLLRSERNSFGRYSYELSHDTLVEPISEVAEKRKRKEEKQRIEKERELERQIAREKQKKQKRIIISISSVAVVAVIAMIIAGFLFFKAQNASQEAQNQKKIAEAALNKVKTALFKEAHLYIQTGEYELAKSKYEYIQSQIPGADTSKAVLKRINLCNQLIEENKVYIQLMEEGNNALIKNDYHEAFRIYSEVLKLKVKTGKEKALLKLNELQSEIDKRIIELDEQILRSHSEILKQNYKIEKTELQKLTKSISEKIK